MRVSTLEQYTSGSTAIDNAQSLLAQTQEQLATGKSINVPSDNPVGAAQIVQLASASTENSQYGTNLGSAKALLAQTDTTLSSVNTLLTSVSTTLISANNAALSSSDKSALATQLQSQLSQLVSLSNTQAPDGSYLFAGYSAGTPPFTQTSSGVTYSGDQGVRSLQVSANRDMAVTVSGDSVFNRVRTGNGVFTTGSSASNTGSASIDTGSVTDPTQLTGDSYSIGFSVSGGQTTYSVKDTTTGTTLSTGNAYTGGSSIDVAGMAVTVSGTPANGDSFSVAPSTNQSVFTTIQNAITQLQSGSTGPAGSLETSIQNIAQAISNTSDVQTTVGSTEDQLTALTTMTTAAGTALTAQISTLQSTDMASAASDLSEEQLVLSAAEQSFAKIAGDSLFNYISH
jgi:flagellar hook-associated protein 3 FlgL